MKKLLLQKERVTASQKLLTATNTLTDSTSIPPTLTVDASEIATRSPSPSARLPLVVPSSLLLPPQHGYELSIGARPGSSSQPGPGLPHPSELGMFASTCSEPRARSSQPFGFCSISPTSDRKSGIDQESLIASSRRSVDSYKSAAEWMQFGGKYMAYPGSQCVDGSVGRLSGGLEDSRASSSCASNTADDTVESVKDAGSEDSRQGFDAAHDSYADDSRHAFQDGYTGGLTSAMSDSSSSHYGLEQFKSPSGMRSGGRGRGQSGRPVRNAVDGQVGRMPKAAGEGHPGGKSIIRCPICGKLFNNSSALAKHKLTHSDERKYTCPKCSKAFKRQDHLNGHMMTHSSKKPFECKFIGCTKSYCDARSLRRHLENHHQDYLNAAAAFSSGMDIGELASEPDQETAGMSGDSKSRQRSLSPFNPRQIWTTGYNPLDEPKPVKCHVCDRGFKNIAALNGHMRLHGGYVRKDAAEVSTESSDAGRSSENHVMKERASPGCHAPVDLPGQDRMSEAVDGRYPFLKPLAVSAIGMEKKSESDPEPQDLMIANLRSDLARHFPQPQQLWASAGSLKSDGGDSSDNRMAYDSPIRWPQELWSRSSQRAQATSHFGRFSRIEDYVNEATASLTSRREAEGMILGQSKFGEERHLGKLMFKPWASGAKESRVCDVTLPIGNGGYPPTYRMYEDMASGTRFRHEIAQGIDERKIVKTEINLPSASYDYDRSLSPTPMGTDLTTQHRQREYERKVCAAENVSSSSRASEPPTASGPRSSTVSPASDRQRVAGSPLYAAESYRSSQQHGWKLESGNEEAQSATGMQDDEYLPNISESGSVAPMQHPHTMSTRESPSQPSPLENIECLENTKKVENDASVQSGNVPVESASQDGSLSPKAPNEFNIPAVPTSNATDQSSSLYRRRLKSLLLKQHAGSLNDEHDQEVTVKSPRLGGNFGALFEASDTSSTPADTSCGDADEVSESGRREAECRSPSGSETERLSDAHCCSGTPQRRERKSRNECMTDSNCGTSEATVLNDSCPHYYTGSENGHFVCHVKDNFTKMSAQTALHECHSHCCIETGVSCMTQSCSCQKSHKISGCIPTDAVNNGCCIGNVPQTLTVHCGMAHSQTNCSKIPSHPNTPSCMELVVGCQHLKTAGHCGTPCCMTAHSFPMIHQSVCQNSSCTPAKKMSLHSCTPKNLHLPAHAAQLSPSEPMPHTPCMAHTPYTPREAPTPREPQVPTDMEPHTPCEEPCTPSDLLCARKCPRTPASQSCHFQFPPCLIPYENIVCYSPFAMCGRRLGIRTPCPSPLNLSIRHGCGAHACTPTVQCCHGDQLRTMCTEEYQRGSGHCQMSQNHESVLCEHRRKMSEIDAESRLNSHVNGSRSQNFHTSASSSSLRTVTPPVAAEPDSTNDVVDVVTSDKGSQYIEMQDCEPDDGTLSDNGSEAHQTSSCDVGMGRMHDEFSYSKLRKLKRHLHHDGEDRNIDAGLSKYTKTSSHAAGASGFDRTGTSPSGVPDDCTNFSQHRISQDGWHVKKNDLENPKTNVDRSPNNPQLSVEAAAGNSFSNTDSYAERARWLNTEQEQKKKHRPDPLLLLPSTTSSVESYGYPSWLRSPCLWEKNGPVPYTPPPMLSPARRGAGLFWSIAAHYRTQPGAAFRPPPAAFSYPGGDDDQPPPTDVEPHINVGSQFQASLPSLSENRVSAQKQDDRADLIFDPEGASSDANDEATKREKYRCSAAMPENASDKESALQHLLDLWRDDVKKAMTGLSRVEPQVPQSNPTPLYTYQDNSAWRPDEIERFQRAVLRHDKDFAKISQEVGTRNAASCIHFYYVWKKVNQDEYRRLNTLRHRRERDELYQLRSAALGAAQSAALGAAQHTSKNSESDH